MRTITTDTQGVDRRAAAEEAVASLGRAVGSLRCAGSQRLVRLGISMTHFHVLTLLRHHDAMPMGRLAEILDVSMSSATGIIDRMEERGLVERVRVPDDRRVVLVQPTQAGLDLVDEAELVKSAVITSALERMTVEQLERLAGRDHRPPHRHRGRARGIARALRRPRAVLARGPRPASSRRGPGRAGA